VAARDRIIVLCVSVACGVALCVWPTQAQQQASAPGRDDRPGEVGSSVAPTAADRVPSLGTFKPEVQAQAVPLGQIHIRTRDCDSGMDLPQARQQLGEVSLMLPKFVATVSPTWRVGDNWTEYPFAADAAKGSSRLLEDDPLERSADVSWRGITRTGTELILTPPTPARRRALLSARGLGLRRASVVVDSKAVDTRTEADSAPAATESSFEVDVVGQTDSAGVLKYQKSSHGIGHAVGEASSKVEDDTVTVGQDRSAAETHIDAAHRDTYQTTELARTTVDDETRAIDGSTAAATADAESARRTVAVIDSPGTSHTEAGEAIAPTVTEQSAVAGARPGPTVSAGVASGSADVRLEAMSEVIDVESTLSSVDVAVFEVLAGVIAEVRTPQRDVPMLSTFEVKLLLHNRGNTRLCDLSLQYELEPGFWLVSCRAPGRQDVVRTERGQRSDTIGIWISRTLGPGESLTWDLQLTFGPSADRASSTPQNW